jgi:hypothetical protein
LPIRVSRSIAAPLELTLHIVVATLLFGVLIGAVVVLNLVTKFCEAHHWLPAWAIQGILGLEIFLYAADLVCFVLFVLVEVRKFCVTVWRNRGA